MVKPFNLSKLFEPGRKRMEFPSRWFVLNNFYRRRPLKCQKCWTFVLKPFNLSKLFEPWRKRTEFPSWMNLVNNGSNFWNCNHVGLYLSLHTWVITSWCLFPAPLIRYVDLNAHSVHLWMYAIVLMGVSVQGALWWSTRSKMSKMLNFRVMHIRNYVEIPMHVLWYSRGSKGASWKKC